MQPAACLLTRGDGIYAALLGVLVRVDEQHPPGASAQAAPAIGVQLGTRTVRCRPAAGPQRLKARPIKYASAAAAAATVQHRALPLAGAAARLRGLRRRPAQSSGGARRRRCRRPRLPHPAGRLAGCIDAAEDRASHGGWGRALKGVY